MQPPHFEVTIRCSQQHPTHTTWLHVISNSVPTPKAAVPQPGTEGLICRLVKAEVCFEGKKADIGEGAKKKKSQNKKHCSTLN